MLDKLLNLLKPNVSIDAKLAGISIFIGKQLDKFNGRIESLEARQLQKGDKGDKGDSVNIKDVEKYLTKLSNDRNEKELEEISKIVVKKWY